jgi:outer membrane protein
MFFKQAGKVVVASVMVALCTTAQADTLLDIYQLALRNDPKLQAAEASYQAGTLIKQQAIAQLLPQIDGTYSYSETDSNVASARIDDSIPDSSTNTSEFKLDTERDTEYFDLSLSQNIFNLAAYFGYKQGKALHEQAELSWTIEQQNLILRVAQAYFAILRVQSNLSTATAEEKAISQQLEQTRQRYDVGLIAITDVHEAQAAYDLAVADRLTEEVNLGIAFELLAVLTGQRHHNLENLSEDFPAVKPDPADVEQWVDFASQNNPSIQLAEQQLEAANQNAKVKTSLMLPSVKAIASYRNTNSDSIDTLRGADTVFDTYNDDESTRFELRVDIPIFSGGQKNAARKQAGYERVAEQARLVGTKREVLQVARSGYLTTLTDVARIQARKRAITSAESALDATQAGYDAGTRNIVDLLNSQRDLFRAQRDYANTRYNYVVNSLRLKLAAGLISPKDIEDINQWLKPKVVSMTGSTSS